MTVLLYLVDAFADRPFVGNPAAVCLLDTTRDTAWMQAVAVELNLSETAFLQPRTDGDWDLRWFTPAVEVDLCGHATLASAHVLWRERHDSAPRLRFHSRSGLLTAELDQQDIGLELLADPPQEWDAPPALAAALGVVPAWTGRCRTGYLAVLADAGQVRELAPDLSAVAGLDTDGVIVTAANDQPEYDFISRFFAPRLGIAEDPVTGAAHCALAPFWSERLGRTRQASRRGGQVGVELLGNRVRLSGQAVTIHSGVLHV